MIGRRASLSCRTAWLALVVAAPSLITLAVMAGLGSLAVRSAVIAGAVILVSTALVIGRFVADLTLIGNGLDRLGAEREPVDAVSRHILRRLAPMTRELWLAIVRMCRVWRARAGAAEAKLAAAETVIAAVPEPLILLDERRRIVRANAHAAAFVGDLPGPRDLAAALRHPELLAAADAVLRGETARVVDFTINVPVERQLRGRFARIARPSLDGAVALVALHDITQLKRAEQMRADFIANASHELRTPLATLIGFIETLRGAAREDGEARERFLAIMHEQASRMRRLVDDLLALSRIELNEHVMPKDPVALGPLLRHVAEALELRAAERRMRILLILPPEIPEVLGDHDELAQVFQNLVDNAIKYGRAGTEIVIAVEVVLRPAGDGNAGPTPLVAVAIRDRGEGIAREHLPRLTERFYRIDTMRSREMGGTGLGLAIVKHILNHHRGFLEVESTLGIGSVFTALLRPISPISGLPPERHRTATEPS